MRQTQWRIFCAVFWKLADDMLTGSRCPTRASASLRQTGLEWRRTTIPRSSPSVTPKRVLTREKAMIMQWFDASEAAKIGVELADQFAPLPATLSGTHGSQSSSGKQGDELRRILQRADSEVRGLRLNFYKKAKFANSFKWRLIENGIEPSIADGVTQSLILHLSQDQSKAAKSSDAAPRQADPAKIQHLLRTGQRLPDQRCMGAGRGPLSSNYSSMQPHNPEALAQLGCGLIQPGPL